jgi:hypothetical protein
MALSAINDLDVHRIIVILIPQPYVPGTGPGLHLESTSAAAGQARKVLCKLGGSPILPLPALEFITPDIGSWKPARWVAKILDENQ